MSAPRTTTAEQDNDILRQYDDGVPMAKIAASFSLSVTSIQKRVRKAQKTLRSPRREWPEEQIRRWFEVDGYSSTQIAEMLGCKRTGIHGLVDRRGWIASKKKIRRKRGPTHGNWKGGRSLRADGYVLVKMPGHHRADQNGYVREHILVMESLIGRPLRPGEVCHHKDHNRSNNTPENLVLCGSSAEHMTLYHGVRPPMSAEAREKIRLAAIDQWRRHRESNPATATLGPRKARGVQASPPK